MNASNETVSSAAVFCGKDFEDFRVGYRQTHGYISLLVCLFGSVANSLNIVVLTRKQMVSPTNAVLTGLAVADLLVMLVYIPYSLHMYLLERPDEVRFTYAWTLFVYFHSNFAQVCHTVSIWLTVTLAVWRYLAVVHPQRSRQWCSMRTTLTAVVSAYVLCPLLCAPHFLAFSVEPLVKEGGNATLYIVAVSRLGEARNALLVKINFWIYSVLMKLTPCVALTLLSIRLILALMETKRRRRNLTSVNNDVKSLRVQEKERQTDRTTRMLLAVLLLFLVTEFPQGVLGLLSGVLDRAFFTQCYIPLGDLMDGLALVNSAVNFILYCSMSQQFRETFSQLFRPRAFDRWMRVDITGSAGNTNITQV